MLGELDILFTLILGVIASYLVVLIYDFYNFRKYYIALYDEVQENYNRTQNDELCKQFSEIKRRFKKRIEDPLYREWVGLGKIIAIWIFVLKTDTHPTDYYRYLSSNNFKNFIQRGYYNYIKGIEESITLFYFYCDGLSIETQETEKWFKSDSEGKYDYFRTTATDDEIKRYIDIYIMRLQGTIDIYNREIERNYKEMKPLLRRENSYITKLFFKDSISRIISIFKRTTT